MVTKTESGLAVYAELQDLAENHVRVRRCHGYPPRVVVETRSTFDGERIVTNNPPELDPKQAKEIAEALLTFCRRVAVHDDAGRPKKQIEVSHG